MRLLLTIYRMLILKKYLSTHTAFSNNFKVHNYALRAFEVLFFVAKYLYLKLNLNDPHQRLIKVYEH